MFHIQPEDDHYQAPKHAVLYVINNIFIYVYQIVVLDSRYIPISFIIKHIGDDEPYDYVSISLDNLQTF